VTTDAPPRPFRIDVHPRAGAGSELVEDARRGLASDPRNLPPKYFYDARGSDLYEQITRLPEYYQARTELSILHEVACGLVSRHAPAELIEIGSGSSRKTEALLDAIAEQQRTATYIPFDVCPEAILGAAQRLAAQYPWLSIHGVAGDFVRHLRHLPRRRGRRAVAFLGGTIGNLEPRERAALLRELALLLEPGDVLIVGTDLQGDPERIRRAYDDSAGVTAQFNLNLLNVLNLGLDADFDPESFQHIARYNEEFGRIEMWLRSARAQSVRLGGLETTLELVRGDEIRTEISCKFTQQSVVEMYESAGLHLSEWHEDPEGRFALSVAVRGSATVTG
jgi:L-histidine N-alpha-methyltransferase